MGFPAEDVAAVLNHVRSDVTAVTTITIDEPRKSEPLYVHGQKP